MLSGMSSDTLHAAVAAWFKGEFAAPTPVQLRAWEAVKRGTPTLISAPTGSGKTLAAFLAVIDDLVRAALAGELADETRVLYVSPLKALSNDIQKNLQAPLAGIRRELLSAALPDAPIRAWVRTGDTPQSERARMRRTPPHILVTTPESLYILLTSDSGRRMLAGVRTVIVDEIHALAGNKRGAHLALSLERLDAICRERPVRVGVSATTKPIAKVADFLTGGRAEACTIIDEGHVRHRDLALELPDSPLEAVMAGEVWTEVYDRLAALIREHTTTLVFVNTRRLAERAARHLAERLGESAVTSHHGSLAKEHRLDAEQRLKAGSLKALVATSSLELGIDVGDIDLVCQIGSPRAIAAFLQRVGRSGHGLGRMPKGRLFPLSRDELVECAGLLAAAGRGELDSIGACDAPLDVLAQQVVAEVAMGEWGVAALYDRFRRAEPFRKLPRPSFDAVVAMLADGFTTQRGRRSAHLHLDRVNDMLRPRRSARLTAITNGGVIPDQFDYDVVLLPAEHPIGTVNEDFAFESMAGDIFQLGNTSYRVRKVETGKVYVEDAHGEPPSMPFWFGDAPGRSDELSAAVSRVREEVEESLETDGSKAAVARLMAELGIAASAAEQLVDYLAAAKVALGSLPTHDTLVFERFFDEAGDAHLVIHSPYGSRINRAWGLALRKRFCRRFNFELQAAALEDSIVISLGAVHSFALEEVVRYVTSANVRDVLAQAVLGAPMFPAQWRWNATTALAVRRFRNGKRAPPQFQRSDAEDLMAVVFPDQIACAENLGGGDREIPDHPLVQQTLADCTRVAMDVAGLERLLARIERGDVRVLCRDLTGPSPLAQEILGAKPYAFLDDVPQEERRTRAVQTRRFMTPEQAADLGRLDPDAIARVRTEAWPEARNADELHDALVSLGFVTEGEGGATAGAIVGTTAGGSAPSWTSYFAELRASRRATTFEPEGGGRLWVAAERLREVELVLPGGTAGGDAARLESKIADGDSALVELVRSRLESLGPVTAAELARPLGLPEQAVAIPLAALEQQGFAMRGRFEPQVEAEQWCERRLLARIHRYTLKRLRSEIEPVSLADYQRFLFAWQGLGAERRQGRDALRAALADLQGFALPAACWERDVLPARIADYGADLLDALCAAGEIVWWRPRAAGALVGPRPSTVAASPIVVVPRAALAHWRWLGRSAELAPHLHAELAPHLRAAHGAEESERAASGADASTESSAAASGADASNLSSTAARVARVLQDRGALFFVEIVQAAGLLRVQVEEALGELVARGLVTADSFNGLRALLAPQRRRTGFNGRARLRGTRSGFDAAGRWTVIGAPFAPDDRDDRDDHDDCDDSDDHDDCSEDDRSEDDRAAGVGHDAAEFAARILLRRYGVVCRAALVRESLVPPWRDLLAIFRRLEARGEIRGGRFVAPLGGEQFALPEAVETLRKVRRRAGEDEWLALSAADPLNLAHLAMSAARVPAVPGRQVVFHAGAPVAVRSAAGIEWLAPAAESEQRRVAAMFADPWRPGRRPVFGR
jgi:ATP-dependent Lhr-like helicase